MSFARARQIADAVLYEGYVLYPYRASARKNRIRWQFGVLAPRDWSEAGGSEDWWMLTECLVEGPLPLTIAGRVRFLQVQERRLERLRHQNDGGFVRVARLEANGRLWTEWDEGIEREVEFSLTVTGPVAQTSAGSEPREILFAFPGSTDVETIRGPGGAAAGRAVRERRTVEGAVIVGSQPIAGENGLHRVSVRIENRTADIDTAVSRDVALRRSLIGVHTLLETAEGGFVSLLDPPLDARTAAEGCRNVRTWPVLAGEPGERTTLLSSPIILYDHPRVAPESAGDLYDATEIDEILTLRTLTLTDEEKREARATDARAAALIDRVDAMTPEALDRLHGTVRAVEEPLHYEDAAPDNGGPPETAARAPWWDPGADSSVCPETDSANVRGVRLSRGHRVRLRPSPGGADAQDMFLAGRTGRVEGVYRDVEDRVYLAVSLENDPSSELAQWHKRFLYFSPDEVEPLQDLT